MALTYLAAAATYYLLAYHKLRYSQTILVQLAATFINRLLPAGIGALGANYAYLRHRRHSRVEAGSVVAVNNLLGFTGHALLLTLALVLAPASQPSWLALTGNKSGRFWLLTAVVVILLLLTGVFLRNRGRYKQASRAITRSLSAYRRRPGRLLAALTSSVLLTGCNIVCLLLCADALGLTLPFTAILLTFTFGVSLGTATPTPGGLGGFEAGLVAGLIAYHVDSSSALATALLYRLISYWLPLALGALALIICQRRGLFNAAA